MKRNVFEYSSSDSETEVPSKKLKLFIHPEILADSPDEPNLSSAENEQDYMDIKLEEKDSRTLEPALEPKETSILKNGSLGLSMMQKMGFKVGESLGVHNTGLVEPISVEVKKGRAGIGATRKLPEGSQITPATIDTFLSHAKSKSEEQRDRLFLLKLQRYCFQESEENMAFLDGKILIKEVNEMWRSYAAQTSTKKSGRVRLFETTDDDNNKAMEPDTAKAMKADTVLDFDLQPIGSQLEQLIAYSRDNYFYCPYCGIKFASDEDMQENCPGPYDQDHAI